MPTEQHECAILKPSLNATSQRWAPLIFEFEKRRVTGEGLSHMLFWRECHKHLTHAEKLTFGILAKNFGAAAKPSQDKGFRERAPAALSCYRPSGQQKLGQLRRKSTQKRKWSGTPQEKSPSKTCFGCGLLEICGRCNAFTNDFKRVNFDC